MNLFLKTKDYAVTGEAFSLMHDEQIGMLITTPQPKNHDQYYNSADYISHTDSRRNLMERLYYLVKQYGLGKKCALINHYGGQSRTLLDIGAGTGDFLAAAKKEAWQVKGIEPNTLARTKAHKKGLILEKELASYKNDKFDIITLWHVLEHLPDLDNKINQIVSLLEDSGTLIIAVPNFKSYDAQYYKHFWAAYDVPRHLWHFSQTAISHLFAKTGMKVIKVKPMVFDAYYVSLLSEKYKNGRSNYLRAFYHGLKSNLKAMRTKEYSSLIYVLKKG